MPVFLSPHLLFRGAMFSQEIGLTLIAQFGKAPRGSLLFQTAEAEQRQNYIPSASSALITGAILRLIQATFLILEAKPLLSFIGVKSGSKMLHPAQKYLQRRSLVAPAVLLSLVMQGVFRGLKATNTFLCNKELHLHMHAPQ